MKKKLLSILTLLLCVCTGAWAASSVTFNYSNQGPIDGFSVSAGNWSSGSPGFLNGATNKALNVSAASGYVITGVTITYVSESSNRVGGTPSLAEGTSATNYSYSISSTTGSISLTGTAQSSLTLNFTNSARMSSIVVNYTAFGGKTALTGAWDPTSVSVAVGADAPSNPTFALSAGTPGTDYTVTYSEVEDDNDIVTINSSTGITAISTTTAGTATIRATATLTSAGEDNYTLATTTYDIEISVLASVAPTVTAAIDKAIVRAGTTVTLTATVTAGTPAPTLQWYTCDADGTNEATIDGATSETYQPSNSSVGTYYFKVKATNSKGTGSSDVVTLTVADAGTSGTYNDLVAVSPGYVFVADDVTVNGTLSPSANTLYDESRVFTSGAFTKADNKGSNTFGGSSHLNSMRLKNTSDYIAFKVDRPCKVTVYADIPSKQEENRTLTVTNPEKDKTYGSVAKNVSSATITITSAGTIFVSGGGADRYIAGFEVITLNETATVGANGYTTFASTYPLDLTDLTEGLTAYKADVDAANSKVFFSPLNQAVPANTGILLQGVAGESYSIPVAAAGTEVTDNDFEVNIAGTEFSAAEGYTYFGMIKDLTPLTFGTFNPSGVIIPANKAYLKVLTTDLHAGARLVSVFGEESTGISTVANTQETTSCEVYNINGQRVQTMQRGLYIVNGKKVIIK